MTEPAARSQSGFTLPELLVVLAISAIVMLALGAAFVVASDGATSASQRLDESRATQLTATYFVADADSAQSYVATTLCFGDDDPDDQATIAPVGSFRWFEGGTRKDVTYAVRAPFDGSPRQLVRRYCEDGNLRSDITVVGQLGSADPTITCPLDHPSCPTLPTQVELSVSERPVLHETGDYTFTLLATPRLAVP